VVFEIITEKGQDHFFFTAAAFAKDSPRYFASNGEGIIGEPLSEEVESLGKNLLAVATPFVSRFKPERDHKLPQRGELLRFALLTPAGVLAAERSLDEVEQDGLGPFALAGDRLIAGLLAEIDRRRAGRDVL